MSFPEASGWLLLGTNTGTKGGPLDSLQDVEMNLRMLCNRCSEMNFWMLYSRSDAVRSIQPHLGKQFAMLNDNLEANTAQGPLSCPLNDLLSTQFSEGPHLQSLMSGQQMENGNSFYGNIPLNNSAILQYHFMTNR